MELTTYEMAHQGKGLYNRGLLETADFTIYPYARHVQYPPDTLYSLYRAMVAEETLERVFYSEKKPDIISFCEYFDRAVLFIATTPDVKKILGAVWFTEPVQNFKANVGIWYSRVAHGDVARDITDRTIRFAMDSFHWRVIWAFTPWRMAARHGLFIGFNIVATLPQFVLHRSGKPMNMYVLKRGEYYYASNRRKIRQQGFLDAIGA